MNSKNEHDNQASGELSHDLNEPVASYAMSQPTIAEVHDPQYEEVLGYWRLLSDSKKEAVLNLLKTFFEDERPSVIPEEEWVMMMKQREDFFSGKAKTYTQEEAREILRNPEKRNALLNNH